MSRRSIIVGNWKMFKTRVQAEVTAQQLREWVGDFEDAEMVVCPPFTALSRVRSILEGSQIALGAQDVHWEDEGAYTGAISVSMLLDCGCRYVLLGHSERRQYFCETDEVIHRKLSKVLTTKLIPVLCVGEKLEEREADRIEEVILGQLRRALTGLTGSPLSRMIIAYEPVWAIGTGRSATPEIAEQVHSMVRDWFRRCYSDVLSSQIRILYGGSVKPQNIAELMSQENIDGALVGGASLNGEVFAKIVRH